MYCIPVQVKASQQARLSSWSWATNNDGRTRKDQEEEVQYWESHTQLWQQHLTDCQARQDKVIQQGMTSQILAQDNILKAKALAI